MSSRLARCCGRRRLVVVAALAVVGCGTSERERVEEAIRERENLAAGSIERVRCERAALMWGCSLQLRDGRTQACQVSVDADGRPQGVGCQPIHGE